MDAALKVLGAAQAGLSNARAVSGKPPLRTAEEVLGPVDLPADAPAPEDEAEDAQVMWSKGPMQGPNKRQRLMGHLDPVSCDAAGHTVVISDPNVLIGRACA